MSGNRPRNGGGGGGAAAAKAKAKVDDKGKGAVATAAAGKSDKAPTAGAAPASDPAAATPATSAPAAAPVTAPFHPPTLMCEVTIVRWTPKSDVDTAKDKFLKVLSKHSDTHVPVIIGNGVINGHLNDHEIDMCLAQQFPDIDFTAKEVMAYKRMWADYKPRIERAYGGTGGTHH